MSHGLKGGGTNNVILCDLHSYKFKHSVQNNIKKHGAFSDKNMGRLESKMYVCKHILNVIQTLPVSPI